VVKTLQLDRKNYDMWRGSAAIHLVSVGFLRAVDAIRIRAHVLVDLGSLGEE